MWGTSLRWACAGSAAAGAALSAAAARRALCDANGSRAAKSSTYSADADVAETWTPLPPRDRLKLESVVIVHRHGDRTPISEAKGAFKWDDSRKFWEDRLLGGHSLLQMQHLHPWIKPFGTDDEFPSHHGRGQLTEKGASQLHDVGVALRARYVHDAGLLPRVLDPADLSVRSTPVPRCYQSASALLLGLYPEAHRTATHHRVPIYSRDSATETMWSGAHMCPAQGEIDQLYEALYAAEHFVEGSEFKEVAERVAEAFGLDDVDVSRLNLLEYGEILNCFASHKEPGHHEPIPNVALHPDEFHDFVGRFDKWRDHQFFHKYRHTNAAVLAGGRLLREIASHLSVPVSSGIVPYKFVEFSCHDTSLVPLMFTLGLMGDDAEWPKYGAFLLLELYRSERRGVGEPEYFVQAVYNGRAVPMGHGTETLLPWKDFAVIVQRNGLSGVKWSKLCASM